MGNKVIETARGNGEQKKQQENTMNRENNCTFNSKLLKEMQIILLSIKKKK